MHIVGRERGAAGERLGMRGGTLVVRKHEIVTAALHIDRVTQIVQRDRGTLDVPARPARAEPAAGPGWLLVPGTAPQQWVQLVPLAGPGWVAAALGKVRKHPRARQVGH